MIRAGTVFKAVPSLYEMISDWHRIRSSSSNLAAMFCLRKCLLHILKDLIDL